MTTLNDMQAMVKTIIEVALPPGRPPVIIYMDGRIREVTGDEFRERTITINEISDGPITIDIGRANKEKPGD